MAIRDTIHQFKTFQLMQTAPISLSSAAIAIAQSKVGVTEVPKGSNSGPDVNEFLKAVGLGPGYAWCMAFVYWSVMKACQELVVPMPLARTGGVMDQWNLTHARKVPNRASNIKPGDIFIMEFAHGTGHTGFVENVGDGVIHTIEGNTNEDGSREGYEVARRVRTISSIHGFIQLSS